ncbi:hypothetical protein ACFVWZ_27615 [Streptomyces sp. NPDC058200]|uniref:hypothetical protein n=1 Tax=Streptomyces sp. NPDC058200 TaxID=3346378 RepID=UPI0036EF0756
MAYHIAVAHPEGHATCSTAGPVGHLAMRLPDALGNLVHWAATGEPAPMYVSPEGRSTGIEQGSRLPAAELTT